MKQYSFIDVCQQELNGIEIPLIQRDYAQGRKQEAKKRGRFLQALHEAVKGKGISFMEVLQRIRSLFLWMVSNGLPLCFYYIGMQPSAMA